MKISGRIREFRSHSGPFPFDSSGTVLVSAGRHGRRGEKWRSRTKGKDGWIVGDGAVTMRSRIENLWKSAAGDGALTPVGVARPESDFDDLMDAWSRERQTSIECRLAMEEAGRLLRE